MNIGGGDGGLFTIICVTKNPIKKWTESVAVFDLLCCLSVSSFMNKRVAEGNEEVIAWNSFKVYLNKKTNRDVDIDALMKEKTGRVGNVTGQ